MMLLVNIFLYLSVAAILLPRILALSEQGLWPTATEMRWIVSCLWALLKTKFSQSFTSLLRRTKKVETMSPVISIDKWKKMPIIDRYQHFLRRKFQEVENVYYPHVDELTKKLVDLAEINPEHIPDFSLHTFTFLREWECGDVTTRYVLDLLKNMNLSDCAEKTVCRRLRNFMTGKEKLDSYMYITAVHDRLKLVCVPMYLSYLEMLLKYFEKLYEIDKRQVKLTWIEQTFLKTGEVTYKATDISLNQIFKEIDSNIVPYNGNKYSVGDNILVFDEDVPDNPLACHWVFGPKEYIKLLQNKFKVTETMSLTEEKAYIKKIIRNFVHDSLN